MNLLQELIKELDEHIEEAIELYYKPIFDEIRNVFQSPSEGIKLIKQQNILKIIKIQ